MNKIFFLLFFLMTPLIAPAQSTYYELRTYYCHDGKLGDLLNRFRNHTTKLFEKHGMENIGYWVPAEGNEQVLYYILGFPDKAAREASWKSFLSDPEWQEVARNSELNGKIVARITSRFMTLNTSLTPAINRESADVPRLFEMRTYDCYPGKYADLIKRFKDHAMTLFEKHGMTNIMYFDTDDGSLLYFRTHPDAETAARSLAAFRSDPQWINVRDESEKDGKIVKNMEGIFLRPVDFSRMR
ncbi:NIPSNAP family protein [Leadbetterella sp. DM7]|uniref:NIPSNAP family protein n=1 Tax=Leadbetterella sp. DM7 TaxID=3235085 RepID=UPI00349EEDD9